MYHSETKKQKIGSYDVTGIFISAKLVHSNLLEFTQKFEARNSLKDYLNDLSKYLTDNKNSIKNFLSNTMSKKELEEKKHLASAIFGFKKFFCDEVLKFLPKDQTEKQKMQDYLPIAWSIRQIENFFEELEPLLLIQNANTKPYSAAPTVKTMYSVQQTHASTEQEQQFVNEEEISTSLQQK